MNDWKCVITLAACCCIVLTLAASASADFVGVTTAIKDDPDTEFLCTLGNGDFVPGPLTVCNVFAVFDSPDDALRSVGNADLQVYNGAIPDVFFQHTFGNGDKSPSCNLLVVFPDLICDSFVTIGVKCSCVGGWFNANHNNGHGDAGSWPGLQVLFLQSSVLTGLTLSGDIDIFWWAETHGDIFAEIDVPIECAATCGSCPTDTDGDGATNAFDLATLLGKWGPVDAGDCQDADDNGLIDAFDLAVLLGAWGPCP